MNAQSLPSDIFPLALPRGSKTSPNNATSYRPCLQMLEPVEGISRLNHRREAMGTHSPSTCLVASHLRSRSCGVHFCIIPFDSTMMSGWDSVSSSLQGGHKAPERTDEPPLRGCSLWLSNCSTVRSYRLSYDCEAAELALSWS